MATRDIFQQSTAGGGEENRCQRRTSFTTHRQCGILVPLLLFSILTPVQYVGAVVANSLALLGDCASLTVDTISYAVSLWAECIDSDNLQRNQLIATACSIFVLLGITGYVIYFSFLVILGIHSDEKNDVNGCIVFWFSVAGLLFDLMGLVALYRGWKKEKSTKAGDLNLNCAGLHVFADLMRNITTLVESILITFFEFGSTATDAWAALIVSFLILIPCAEMIRECVLEYHNYYVIGNKEVHPLIDINGDISLKPKVLL